MRNVLMICLIGAALGLQAQRFSSEIFHPGYLVTTDKDTIRGSIKYDMEANLVTIVIKGKAMSFSSQKVFYFEIFDDVLKNYRQFYSIVYNVNYNYKIPIFFEVVYEGKLSLLRRERIISQAVNTTMTYWGTGGGFQNVIDYQYFFLSDKGKITYYTGKKKDLFRIMIKKQAAVKTFVKENRLDTDRVADLVRITAFYNSI